MKKFYVYETRCLACMAENEDQVFDMLIDPDNFKEQDGGNHVEIVEAKDDLPI